MYGREGEIVYLERLLDGLQQGVGAAAAVVGAAGTGKSVLLDAVGDSAARRSMTVLRVAGAEPERRLPFAALHRLLEPLWSPSRRPDQDIARTLRAAIEAGTGPDGHHRVANAALELLTASSTSAPLVAVVDDRQWIDDPTADVLAFVARRIERVPLLLLTASRPRSHGSASLAAEAHLTSLHLRELDDVAAGALLDSLPQRPTPAQRTLVLQQAAGNPLALLELARAVTDGTAQTRLEPTGLLPLTPALKRIHGERLPGLDATTRQALLVAAAAGEPDRAAVLTAVHLCAAGADDPLGLEVWQAAEEAGLVTVEDGRVRFRHPLVRSAVYQAAPFAARRKAHLALAAALGGSPDRQAWHRSAAALGPDEEIAQDLVATAERARRRGGYQGAADAMRRAAELTREAPLRTLRLLEAAELAMFAGLPDEVAAITTEAVASTDDPQSLSAASIRAGWALAVTTRHSASLGFLLPAAAAVLTRDPRDALAALSTAATVIYNSGDPRSRDESLRLAAMIAALPGRAADRLWAQAGCDPFGDRPQYLRLLAEGAAEQEPSLPHLILLGAGAWILDETHTSLHLLGQAQEHLQRVTTTGANATLSAALGLVQYESGAWQAARSTCTEAYRVARVGGLEMAAASSWSLVAALDAVQGDTARARTRLAQAMAGIEPTQTRAMAVRARLVLASAATADGDHPGAWEQLRGLFAGDADATPLHYHASFYAVADLAAAAARVDRRRETLSLLEAVEDRLQGGTSMRLGLLLRRARALLSGPEDAEEHFLAALDPAGDPWPFERAKARLEYGEWLRRRRRVNDARPVLAGALAVFERLGAKPWAARCAAELRACGVTPQHTDGPHEQGGAGLTAQQLQIARLAAEGLSNREIGERLLLSPRTIGFHLYQVFPKLGVTARSQLRRALDEQVRTGHPGGLA
ncbi:ATP-binding protein [Kitasatospora sp. NPDC057015]|uniref:ATP-binding protein n=1 Tax=Kitasatospora sp. NPDC057015 TaxID=3346001 RepID=UPI003645A763